MGSSVLKWNLMISLTYLCSALKWHDLVIGNNKCQMQDMDPLENYFYILLWKSPETTSKHVKIDSYFEDSMLYGNESCIYDNCLFTHSTYLMNINNYDAILFNGRTLMKEKKLPRKHPRQVFGFVQMESAQKFPIKNSHFDNFFHLTISYKLDSDIPMPYFTVNYLNGLSPKPRNKIRWIMTREKLDRALKLKIYGKNKLVAWIEHRCKSLSKRERFVHQLNAALIDLKFNQTVDIFGDCGNRICNKTNQNSCLNMISERYLFNLAFEDSFAEDYVTDEVLNAVQHDTVPIVFGGVDYRRFLPRKSYINACELGPRDLAEVMVYLYYSRKYYENFFKWRHLYAFNKLN